MKLLVFGSTGPTGRQIVEQALASDHDVSAFARTPDKLDIAHDRLTIVQGDVTDAESVARAMPGHDAVLCAIGAPGLDKSRIRERGTRVIVDAMRQGGVRRLICLSSLGVGDSRGVLTFGLKFVIVPLLLRHAFADHAQQEAIVRESDLDWTLIRPPHLNDGPHTGRFQHGFTARDKGITLKIARADVADFMLRQLDDQTYLRKAASVSS